MKNPVVLGRHLPDRFWSEMGPILRKSGKSDKFVSEFLVLLVKTGLLTRTSALDGSGFGLGLSCGVLSQESVDVEKSGTGWIWTGSGGRSELFGVRIRSVWGPSGYIGLRESGFGRFRVQFWGFRDQTLRVMTQAEEFLDLLYLIFTF